MRFDAYEGDGFYDEMFEADGEPRAKAEMLFRRLEGLSEGEVERRQLAAERTLLNMGITFNVYGHEAGTEKVWPFDIVPRIIEWSEWSYIERGLKQRIKALNMFIDDIYNDVQIVKDGIVPEYLVGTSKTHRSVCRGMKPPGGVWCHITGTDLVRAG